LINDADYETAVAVAVDGLSIFHFSELRATEPERRGEPKYRYYVVPPHSSMTVPGWFKRDDLSLAFRVTPFAEGVAAKLGRTSGIGMISATFHASWEEGKDKPPADEPGVQKLVPVEPKKGLVREYIGPDGRKYKMETMPVTKEVRVSTGFGQEIVTNSRGVKRNIGVERGFVTLRYERPAR
jgi:hypothetical protein